MKTDDLIDALTANLEPEAPRRPAAPLALSTVIGLFASGLILAATLGVRADFQAALPAVLAKAAFSAAAAAAFAPALMRLLMPGRPIGWRLIAAALLLALALAIAGVALMGDAPERRMESWTGGGFPWCLVIVPALAAPAAAALTWFARDLAPTRPPLAGAAIGGFAGGIGAMVYAMYCPVDSVAFVTTWYSLAIGLCAAIGALVGSRVLRW